MKADRIWYQDVSVLARRPLEFFPGKDQTPAERINAVVRLLAYASLAAYAWNRRARTLVMGAAAVAVVSLAFTGRHEGLEPEADYAAGPGAKCVRPTRDNPFANALVGDDPLRAQACEWDSIKDEATDYFNTGLYRDAWDVYGRNNSQHAFYTVPVSNGFPDTQGLAQFLYGGAGRCKTDQASCTPGRPV